MQRLKSHSGMFEGFISQKETKAVAARHTRQHEPKLRCTQAHISSSRLSKQQHNKHGETKRVQINKISL